MKHPFLTDEQYDNLQKFAKCLAAQGSMTRITNDDMVKTLLAMNGVCEPAEEKGKNSVIALLGNEEWCFVVAKHYGHVNPDDNGLCALKIDRKYLMEQFAPSGISNPFRQKKIFDGLCCLLMVDPRTVDIDSMSAGSFGNN